MANKMSCQSIILQASIGRDFHLQQHLAPLSLTSMRRKGTTVGDKSRESSNSNDCSHHPSRGFFHRCHETTLLQIVGKTACIAINRHYGLQYLQGWRAQASRTLTETRHLQFVCQIVLNPFVGGLSNPTILVYNFTKTDLLVADPQSTIYPQPELACQCTTSNECSRVKMQGFWVTDASLFILFLDRYKIPGYNVPACTVA